MLGSTMLKGNTSVSGSWNFGPREDEVRSVDDVTREVIKVWGEGTVKLDSNQNHPHEATLLQLDCSKARTELGWSPRWGFLTTMDKTVSWYKSVHSGRSALTETQDQLKQYEGENND